MPGTSGWLRPGSGTGSSDPDATRLVERDRRYGRELHIHSRRIFSYQGRPGSNGQIEPIYGRRAVPGGRDGVGAYDPANPQSIMLDGYDKGWMPIFMLGLGALFAIGGVAALISTVIT